MKLQLDEDRLILSVNAPDSGAAEEELAVAYGDEPLEIGFNAKYLLEIASQVDRENAVFMFNSSGLLSGTRMVQAEVGAKAVNFAPLLGSQGIRQIEVWLSDKLLSDRRETVASN